MTEAASAAAGFYETYFVPALFRQWTGPVLEAAHVKPGDRVVDVACGTGVLARAAAARGAAVVGVDVDPAMLAVAARLAPGIEWRQGTAESLTDADGAFDVAVSQFGLMFFADRRAAIAQMLRVVRHGGRVAVAVWDDLAHAPGYAVLVELLQRRVGDRAADALRRPFVLGDRVQLAALFADAGASTAAITTHGGRARFPDIRTWVDADVRGWLPLVGITLDAATHQALLSEAERALRSFAGPDGRVEFPVSAHVVTVTKP